MLNIFYGRESIDKEKFIYETIAQTGGRTLVIVPDQYTLEAEKQAFRHLHVRSMMEVEITSLSRLGSRLIEKQGGGSRTFIDKYGRHMLLAQIGAGCEDRMKVFKGSLRKNSFIEMTNNFISEMKQYNVKPEDLSVLGDSLEEGSLLAAKLADLQLLFSEYQKRIEGKYTDSEDYIDLYMEKIKTSALIAESSVWVYGFDSFAPKAMEVLGNLMAAARDVNVFLTWDHGCRDEEIFKLTEIVMEGLCRQADAFGAAHRRHQVAEGTGWDCEKNSPALVHLEKELYAHIKKPLQLAETSEREPSIVLTEAANMYSEAESAASYMLHLLQDKGLRCRDMMVICNDQNVRGSIISRVFEEWGITLFDDKKRSILSSTMAVFVVALVEAAANKYRTSDVFKVLKTGFSDLSDEEIEVLENYTIKYRIKGSMWQKPFVKGVLEYGDDGLAEIEVVRQKVMTLLGGVEKLCREAETTGGFIEAYYDFLMEEACLGDKIIRLMEAQENQGLMDLAEETSQIWGKIVGLFEQIGELIGDDPFDGKNFVQLLITGLSQMEVGVLPPTSDEVVMGTMQRTRSGRVKAVIVIGANEGLLPTRAPAEGLFSVEELEFLASEGKELCKVDKIRVMEEQLAIYRNLSKATDYLWISYAASDEEGKEARPSEVVDTLRRIFPNLPVREDVISSGYVPDLVGGRLSTLRHLTGALHQGRKGERVDSGWKTVADWYKECEPQLLGRIGTAMDFTNQQKDLPKELAQLLYKRDTRLPLTLSPSRLEKFSRCPFSHFVAYGLRPEERRIFQAAGREIGDIYHRCLMEVSRRLTEEDRWETVTQEECRALVCETAEQEAANYREGIFDFSNEERYKAHRIEDTCFFVCWALIEQVRAGTIKESLYEVPFGRGKSIASIEVDAGNQKILIEGKIDRLDVLEEDRVKIIDYKTGRESFHAEEARGGYRLQLMLYLKAAQEQVRKPAGVFYFLIGDKRVDLTGIEKEKISEKILKEMRKFFRLDGIMVDDGKVIDGIAGEFDGYSDILPLRNSREGIKATSDGFLLTEEEFQQLQADVDRQIEKLCGQLAEGRIEIRPKKTDRESPCTYCEYKSICRFDLAFPGCNYEVIK